MKNKARDTYCGRRFIVKWEFCFWWGDKLEGQLAVENFSKNQQKVEKSLKSLEFLVLVGCKWREVYLSVCYLKNGSVNGCNILFYLLPILLSCNKSFLSICFLFHFR